MRRLVTLIALFALLALPARGFAAEAVTAVTGSGLASAESGLSGQMVQFEGEVVSERLYGGEGYVWVNVLSEGTAIGVWMAEDLARDLDVLGTWRHTGDYVLVTGEFNEACDQHGGDLDVHATTVTLIERGSEREQPVSWWKLAIAAGGALVAWFGYRRMRRAEEEIVT